MKHSGFAWIAAFSLSVLAALPFTAAAQDSNPVFDKTTARLEKGGIAYSFTDGAAAYQMVDGFPNGFGRSHRDFIAEDDADFADLLPFAVQLQQSADFQIARGNVYPVGKGAPLAEILLYGLLFRSIVDDEEIGLAHGKGDGEMVGWTW